ncbi:hypothetical protein [Crassaminicella profunda]|uniref:hypothetical protein n=1 Tax=Crassaminicella profunda TaxID=1286698 RepID=UPI001CA6B268|nr:hypothetical protein [Crassaminicella profunda]QZY56785.1 hypothetical protein K7H06_07640 [Crassaminicella profunda]
MNKIPDVVGLELKRAVEMLDSAFQLSIKETNSPKLKEVTGECRVVKQKNMNHNIELIVSYF